MGRVGLLEDLALSESDSSGRSCSVLEIDESHTEMHILIVLVLTLVVHNLFNLLCLE